MSAFDALKALRDAITGSVPLSDFVSENFSRSLTIRFAYRFRDELNVGDLPALIITRPRVSKRFATGVRDGSHTVMLYLVFHQDDREKGAEQLITFEELLDDAIVDDVTLGGAVISAVPKETVNDEGKHHPVYCIVTEIELQHRRTGL